MKTLEIWLITGTRPNLVKAAPLWRSLREAESVTIQLVDTGQHYDAALTRMMLHDLELPDPDFCLDVRSGTHAAQTAEIMRRLDLLLVESTPDCVVVFGDTNSTVAAALTAAKRGIPLAHVESGLRSFDRSMPEEINRVVTDAISDLCFVTEEAGCVNLRNEGVPSNRIHLVGNTMIDSLDQVLPRVRATQDDVLERIGLQARQYGVLTLHRPANVDDEESLARLLRALDRAANGLPIVFPVHPRTRTRLDGWDLSAFAHLRFVETLGYVRFASLLYDARFVLTDSGGVQEESTVLGVPCLTLRPNTERPVTIHLGTSRLVGNDPQRIDAEIQEIVDAEPSAAVRPPLWDGKAGQRIAMRLLEWLRAPQGGSDGAMRR